MSHRVTKALGEIALRVSDMDAMRDFYRDVIGLEVIREAETFAFFRIAEGNTVEFVCVDETAR